MIVAMTAATLLILAVLGSAIFTPRQGSGR